MDAGPARWAGGLIAVALLLVGCSSGGDGPSAIETSSTVGRATTTTTTPVRNINLRLEFERTSGNSDAGIYAETKTDGANCGVLNEDSVLADPSDTYGGFSPDAQVALTDAGKVITFAELGIGTVSVPDPGVSSALFVCSWTPVMKNVPYGKYRVEVDGVELGLVDVGKGAGVTVSFQ